MTFTGALAVISTILIWTVVREELLDRYWRYQQGNHLAEFGNLYVVIGCVVGTTIILLSIL